MNIFLETLGCRLNYSEMQTLASQLSAVGHQVVTTPQEADVCVLNTCAVTAEAARKSRQIARKLVRANPSARLAVTGCYATLAPDTVKSLPRVQLVVDNQHKDRLADLLQPWSADLDGEGWRRLQPEAPVQPPARTRAFVKAQDGCNNRCTFCIVTVARGQERSRPIDDVVADLRQMEAEGYQEAVLTGVHLGGYGSDLGTDLRQLVEAILDRTGLPRLRLSSIEPWDLQPAFFDLWPASGGRLCPHLHLPLQAGCDATLKRMARRNRTAEFRDLVAEARARIPGLVITTDIIAGFPGESRDDFDESLAFLAEMAFAHIHAFPYSNREGTAAARFQNQIAAEERKQRVTALQRLARTSGEAVRRGFLGQVRPVLWEKLEHPGNGVGPVWSGLTDNFLRVQTLAHNGIDLENRITQVKLDRLDEQVPGKPWDVLWGSMVTTTTT